MVDVTLNIIDPGVQLNITQTAIGAAGGDLTGAFPNPTINPQAVAISTDPKDDGRRNVAAHDQSAAPHGGRFTDFAMTQIIATSEGHRQVTRATRAVPSSLSPDQSSLTSQFFGG